MKFLSYSEYFFNKQNIIFEDFFLDNLNFYYNDDNLYEYEKDLKRNRKIIRSVRPGVAKSLKKNSIKRDTSYSLIQQFINLNQKKGKKINFLFHMNKMVENLFFSFSYEMDEFKYYNNYNNYVYLHNFNSDFADINKLLNFSITGLESIFEIKTKKNNKKLKLDKKYSHEIVYIPRERRLKYVLRSLSLYKESFKNYNLWERLFWSFFIIIINKNKSFLKKRKEYIYVKSIKFFKKSKPKK